MPSRVIKAILKADDKASPAFVRLGNAIKVVGTIAGAVGAIQLGRTLVRGLDDATEKAAVQELQEKKLQAALQTTAQYSSDVFRSLKDQAAALQKLTDVGDEEILVVQSLLLQFGATKNEVTRLTEATLDLAKTTGQDYKSAALAVGKAVGGNVGALNRYGTRLDKATLETKGTIAVTKELERVFGGRARAEADTYTGSINQLSNAYGDLQEAIGYAITKSPAIRDLIKGITEGVQTLTENLEGLSAEDAIKTGISTLGTLSKAVLSVGTTAYNAGLSWKLFLQALGAEPADEVQKTLDAIQAGYNRSQKLKSEIDKIIDRSITGPEPAKIDAAGTHEAIQRQIQGAGPIEIPTRLDQPDQFEFELPPVDLDWKPKPLPGQTEVRVPVTLEPKPIDRKKFLTPIQILAQDLEIDLGLADQARKLGIALETVSLQPITDETLQVRRGLEEMTTQVLDQLAPGFRSIAEDDVAAIGEALAVLNESGVAGLIEYLKNAKDEANDLSETLKHGLGDIAVRGAMKLGDTLVDAAFGADASFNEFAKNMLKQIAEMIVQALILKAILSATGGPAGFFGSILGFAGGGIVPAKHAQRGLIVRGGLQGRDTVPILAQADEAVLPRYLTDYLLRSARADRDFRTTERQTARDNRRTTGGQTFNVFLVDSEMSQTEFRRRMYDDPDGFVEALQNAARVRAF